MDSSRAKPTVFLRTPFASVRTRRFPPMAAGWPTTPDESGRHEIYVRPFPGPGGKWQISTGGGRFPTWSRNGRELFFCTLAVSTRIRVVSYQAEENSFPGGKTPAMVGGAIYRTKLHSRVLRPPSRREAFRRAQGGGGYGSTGSHSREHRDQLVRRGPPPRRPAGQN